MVPRLDLLKMVYSSGDNVLQGVQDQRCDITIQAGLLMVVLHREDAVHGNPDLGTKVFHLVITQRYKKLQRPEATRWQ